jgi:predicted metal-dependent hydrolase
MSKPDFKEFLLEGIENFSARRFWEAHESWETLWLEAQSNLEQFLQGLIQIAAAYHHIQRGTLRGAPRLFAAALKRLEPFPLVCCGVDRTEVDAAARRHQRWLKSGPETPLEASEYPRLGVPDASAIAPTSLQW